MSCRLSLVHHTLDEKDPAVSCEDARELKRSAPVLTPSRPLCAKIKNSSTLASYLDPLYDKLTHPEERYHQIRYTERLTVLTQGDQESSSMNPNPGEESTPPPKVNHKAPVTSRAVTETDYEENNEEHQSNRKDYRASE